VCQQWCSKWCVRTGPLGCTQCECAKKKGRVCLPPPLNKKKNSCVCPTWNRANVSHKTTDTWVRPRNKTRLLMAGHVVGQSWWAPWWRFMLGTVMTLHFGVVGCWLFATVCCLVAVACWWLAAAFWWQDAGCCLLIIGCKLWPFGDAGSAAAYLKNVFVIMGMLAAILACHYGRVSAWRQPDDATVRCIKPETCHPMIASPCFVVRSWPSFRDDKATESLSRHLVGHVSRSGFAEDIL